MNEWDFSSTDDFLYHLIRHIKDTDDLYVGTILNHKHKSSKFVVEFEAIVGATQSMHSLQTYGNGSVNFPCRIDYEVEKWVLTIQINPNVLVNTQIDYRIYEGFITKSIRGKSTENSGRFNFQGNHVKGIITIIENKLGIPMVELDTAGMFQ